MDKIKTLAGLPDKPVVFDSSAGGGDSVRYSDCSRMMDIGWSGRENLDDGLRNTIEWYRDAGI